MGTAGIDLVRDSFYCYNLVVMHWAEAVTADPTELVERPRWPGSRCRRAAPTSP